MQVTEVSAEGLKRNYKITVGADEIESRVDARLKKLAQNVRMPGFRPGKAPINLLRKQYGRSVMGEVLEQAVEEGQKKVVADNALRPALRPRIEVTSFDTGKDLEFTMDVEVLPAVPEVDLAALTLTRPVFEPADEQVENALEGLARNRRRFTPLDEPRPAAAGDQLLINFLGKIDGEPFEGGKAEDFTLELGSSSLIPGFEEQLIGAEAGEERTIEVVFPEDYAADALRGRTATFDVKVKEIRAAPELVMDDAFATGFGAEDMADLRAKIRERLLQEYAQMGRQRVKRQLLDELAGSYDFEVPAGMVEIEFESIWKQLQEEMKRTGRGYDEGMSEEEARAEYRAIAERRVRLGLLLSDIGTKAAVTVEPQEMQQALIAHVRNYPGREQEMFDKIRNNQAALEQLRAPLFEEKVVDHILATARVEDQPVSLEELMHDSDEDHDHHGHAHDHDHGHHDHEHAHEHPHADEDKDASPGAATGERKDG